MAEKNQRRIGKKKMSRLKLKKFKRAAKKQKKNQKTKIGKKIFL